MSDHDEFVCVECQRDEAIKERDEARKEVAALTERRQRLLTTVRRAFKKLRRLRDIWRDTENDCQRLLLEVTQQHDEARKDRDGWRASEQETSREYHELRELNTKVRRILGAPSDCSTDDAAEGVVRERDRWHESTEKLTAERKDVLEQRDEARQQRDEAQKLAVERGEQIEVLKHDLKRADAECSKAWEHRDALASRFCSIDRVLAIYPGDADETLQAVQKVVYERNQAVRERDELREQVEMLAQELERTKTLLAEDRAELRELRDHDKRTAEDLIHVRHDLSASHGLLGELRSIVGAGVADDTREAVRRVVRERDAAVSDLAEQRRREAKQHENWGKWADEEREVLRAGPNETTADAVRRVVAERDAAVDERNRLQLREKDERDWLQWTKEVRGALRARPTESTGEAIRRVIAERDEAVQYARDAKRALNPAELPPGLRWVWEGSDFDGSGRWAALYESLIVGRVERCSATSCTPAGWRWQRLDGTRDWGIEDDEHTGLVGLARHLHEHPPLAAATSSCEQPPSPPANALDELPPALHWVPAKSPEGDWYVSTVTGPALAWVTEDAGGWRWWLTGSGIGYGAAPTVAEMKGLSSVKAARNSLAAHLRQRGPSSKG